MNNQRLRNTILYVCLAVWTAVWFVYTGAEIKSHIRYYRMASRFSLDTMREFVTTYTNKTKDYYSILKFCDEALFPGERVRLIISDIPIRASFLWNRGRYYLYPRTFGDMNDENANCILVYGVKNFEIPEGFRVYAEFSEDKYMLVNARCRVKKP